MSKHLDDYDTVLAQHFGSGVSACWRGYRLWDDDSSKQLVLKWTGMFHKYRDVLTDDIVHLVRPNGQDIDGYMHVRNPAARQEGSLRTGTVLAVALFFNPIGGPAALSTTFDLPLSYAGAQPGQAVSCRQEEDRSTGRVAVVDAFFRVPFKVAVRGLRATYVVCMAEVAKGGATVNVIT